ncbi:hypothetical protein DL98DRAFT_534548 [Cadophora sp. DSE1049]|nr:hypothetical protein DL98DRAFT_534548 [Cadophora sp. DSE1049]
MAPQNCTWCKHLLRASHINNHSPKTSPPEHESAFSPCQYCKAIYCSASCESGDKLHHALCTTYTSFIATKPRPSTSHKLALLLPSDVDTPRFIWLKTQIHRSNLGSPIFEDHLGPDHPAAQSIHVNEDLSASNTKEPLSKSKSTLIASIRSTYAEDGSLQNWCIEKMIPSELAQQWRGPVVISLKTGLPTNTAGGARTKPAFYADFNLGDLHKVQHFLRKYVLPGKDIIQGVRIRCQGEVTHLNKTAVSLASIPKDHAIFNDLDDDTGHVPVSNIMGVPLLIYNAGKANYAEQDLTAAQKKAVQNDLHFNKNPAVTYLTLDTVIRSKTWGSLDKMQWGDGTGTILIARRDRKPLSPHQVEALVCYCRDILYGAMQKVRKMEAGLIRGGKTELREEMTSRLMDKKSFERYFETLKRMKGICDGSWAEEMSIFST